MDRIYKLKKNMFEMDRAGVRYSLREKFISESIKETIGEPRDIRRAKAFKNILDNVDLIILPEELVIGSVLGLLPIMRPQPVYKDIYKEAKKHLFNLKTKPMVDSRNLRYAIMERDFYAGTIPYNFLQKVSRKLTDEFGEKLKLNHTEIYHELEQYFSQNREIPKEILEFQWFQAHHIPVNYEKVLNKGNERAREKAEQTMVEVRKAIWHTK